VNTTVNVPVPRKRGTRPADRVSLSQDQVLHGVIGQSQRTDAVQFI
jgi:hypothetical protein